MNTLHFELPWPPSVNNYWRSVAGRVLISREGRAYRESVCWLVPRSTLGPRTGPLKVQIEAWMPDKRRRDLDNLCKAPLDALTAASVWEDDSQIVDLRITKHVGVKPGKLRIWVEAVNG